MENPTFAYSGLQDEIYDDSLSNSDRFMTEHKVYLDIKISDSSGFVVKV